MKVVGSLAGLLFFLASLAAAADGPVEAIRPTSVIQLFNGKDLTNFYSWLQDTKYEDPRKVFTVHDGLLHISGDGMGCVTTKQAYRDYHLVTEWKWGPRTWEPRADRTKDSGILVHCVGEDGCYNGIWMNSIEAQIIEGGCGDFILVVGKNKDGSPMTVSLTCELRTDDSGNVYRDKMGIYWQKGGKRETLSKSRINWFGRDPNWKDVLGFRGKNDVEKPDGEWNRMEVICDGGHITNIVNGVVVNEGFDASPSAGRIIVQSEKAEILFRRIELWPLGTKPN
jgi:hypothetical protein